VVELDARAQPHPPDGGLPRLDRLEEPRDVGAVLVGDRGLEDGGQDRGRVPLGDAERVPGDDVVVDAHRDDVARRVARAPARDARPAGGDQPDTRGPLEKRAALHGRILALWPWARFPALCSSGPSAGCPSCRDSAAPVAITTLVNSATRSRLTRQTGAEMPSAAATRPLKFRTGLARHRMPCVNSSSSKA